VLAEVYAAGEPPIVAADGRALMHALRVAGQAKRVRRKHTANAQAIMQMARDGDVVITMERVSIGSTPNKCWEKATLMLPEKMPAMQVQRLGVS